LKKTKVPPKIIYKKEKDFIQSQNNAVTLLIGRNMPVSKSYLWIYICKAFWVNVQSPSFLRERRLLMVFLNVLESNKNGRDNEL
jgi:hypothetical protein